MRLAVTPQSAALGWLQPLDLRTVVEAARYFQLTVSMDVLMFAHPTSDTTNVCSIPKLNDGSTSSGIRMWLSAQVSITLSRFIVLECVLAP